MAICSILYVLLGIVSIRSRTHLYRIGNSDLASRLYVGANSKEHAQLNAELSDVRDSYPECLTLNSKTLSDQNQTARTYC